MVPAQDCWLCRLQRAELPHQLAGACICVCLCVHVHGGDSLCPFFFFLQTPGCACTGTAPFALPTVCSRSSSKKPTGGVWRRFTQRMRKTLSITRTLYAPNGHLPPS